MGLRRRSYFPEWQLWMNPMPNVVKVTRWRVNPTKKKKKNLFHNGLAESAQGRPDKRDVDALVKAYALKMVSQEKGAPMRVQMRFDKAFNRKWNALIRKYQNHDLNSEWFFSQLERKAKAYARKHVIGPGKDW